jgi:hypothetical protein
MREWDRDKDKTIECEILVMIPGEKSRTETITIDGDKTWDEMLKPYLGECWTEHVYVYKSNFKRGAFKPWNTPEHQRMDMFVDESGVMKDLPLNMEAMMFYPGEIFGPAVLFKNLVVWS